MKVRVHSARRFFPLWRSALGVLSLSLAVLFGCPQLFAQGSAGRILGAVTDQTGGAVAGATVTVVDTQRNLTRTLTTDAAGEYNAPNLLPSTYTVRSAYQGFKTAERSGVTLEVNQDLRVDLVMQPGEQTEKVTVTGELPLVETTNAVVGGTIQNNVINDLPLNGRNFTNLLVLRPGTVKYAGGSGWTQSTNGLRPHDQNYQVDGIDSNDPWMAQSVMNAVMAAGDAGTMLPIDAIDEFRTEQNPEAQYGWKPGGVINVGVKSGTNNVHGTAYAYGRSNAFDARSFFNPPPVNGVCAVGPLAACDQAALNLEQFGASVGGPIKKDKLFYFANYEQQRYTNGNPAPHFTAVTSGPGALDSGDGLIGACLAAGAKLSPLSAQLAGLSATCTPLANFPGLFPAAAGAAGGPATLVTSLNSNTVIHSGIAKVDYHLNAKNSIDASYFISPGNGIFVDNPTLQVATPWLTNQYARSQVFSGTWTFTPGSAWVNEFRGGYSHYYQTFLSNDFSQNPANYTFNGATYHVFTGQTDIGSASSPAFGGLPQLRISAYSMQFGLNWPKYVGPDGVLNLVDHVSYLRGKHSFMFGAEFLNNASTNTVTQYAKGQVQFKTLDDFFTSTVQRGHFAAGNFANWQRQLSDQGYAAFLQDSWHVKPRLTVNLGLRYEVDTVMKDKNNLLGNFDPTLGLVQVGNQIKSPYNGDHNNFAPRLGMAWDIFGNGKTVLRASGDVMYEQFSFDSFNALGNLLGSRTVPTGATLAFTNAAGAPVITTAGGTINIGAIAYTGGAAKKLGANWAANSATTPLFFGGAACGDGTVTLPNGITPGPCEIEGIARNMRNPYVTMWTVDLQRAITNNLSLDMAYVGNHGTKLLGLTDLNQPPVGAGWGLASDLTSPLANCIGSPLIPGSGPGPTNCAPDPGLQAAASPLGAKFPYLSYVDWLSNLGKSNYNALQVTLTQRNSHGLSFIAGYTYSHALDMSSDNWGAGLVSPINNSTVGNLYGNSMFDITHNFTLSATYAIPGRKGAAQMLEGWSLNSIVTLQSGMPWGVNDFTTDFSGTNEVGASSTEGEWWNFYGNPKDFQSTRAFLDSNGGSGGIPYFPGSCAGDCTALPAASAATANATCNAKAAALGPAAVASLATLGCYANGSSVLIPPAYGTLGNSGRDNFRGFPFYNWDLSISKEFKFRERLTAQFRAEAFNILNRVNFSNVFGGPGGDNTYTDPTAGAGASFGFRPQTPDITSSNPTLGAGGPRALQLGLKLIF
jgi:Carboxypeptidase regulatory-like domain/TonB dependent receptor